MAWPRVHLFEFEDLTWFPKIFRRAITDLLTYQIDYFKIYNATIPKIQDVLAKTGHSTIVDLCSGSGGPALSIGDTLSKALNRDISFVLTDKYPNVPVFQALNKDRITSIMESIDARKVPSKLKGFRTLFTAFHHFRPADAKQILQDAVDAKMPIGIFEITERKPASLMTLIMAPITCLIFSLVIRPRKLGRLFWTYVIPIIPILYTWDGLISNLRSYTKKEWLNMTERLSGERFHWETGELPSKGPIKVMYLVGYPLRNSKREGLQ